MRRKKPKKKTVIDLNQNIEKINDSNLESKETNDLSSEKELGYQISLLENENDFNIDSSAKNDETNEILNDQINNEIEDDNFTKNQSLKEESSFVNNKIVLDLSDSIDNIDNKNSLDLENCISENKAKIMKKRFLKQNQKIMILILKKIKNKFKIKKLF